MAVQRNPTVPNPGSVTVSPTLGQSLHFKLTVSGPKPIFSFVSDVKGVLFEAPDFPGNPTVFEWDHLKNPSDIQQLERLMLGLSFLTNANYQYQVEVRDSTGAVVTRVLDISYTGAPTDTQDESIRVVIQ